jgi:hypothetical protein
LSPSASASLRRFSTTTPTPSPGTKPSARSSKVWQRPCGDSMLADTADTWKAGVTWIDTPPASAMSVSPLRRLWQAMWIATSELEQAVSSATAGPCRFR